MIYTSWQCNIQIIYSHTKGHIVEGINADLECNIIIYIFRLGITVFCIWSHLEPRLTLHTGALWTLTHNHNVHRGAAKVGIRTTEMLLQCITIFHHSFNVQTYTGIKLLSPYFLYFHIRQNPICTYNNPVSIELELPMYPC